MADTTFVDNVTVVNAAWLNDVNTGIYDILGNGTVIPVSKAALVTSLGLNTSATGSSIVSKGTTAQRDGTPISGYFRFNSTLDQFEGYTTAEGWGAIGGGGGAAGTGTDEVGYENDQWITQSFVVGQGAMTSGATITIATPAVVSIANTFVAGQPIRFTTTGALPTGLVVNSQYFVSLTGLTTSAFQVAATQAAALAGTGSIATSGTQSGVHSVGKSKDIIVTGGIRLATGASFTVPSGSKAVFP